VCTQVAAVGIASDYKHNVVYRQEAIAPRAVSILSSTENAVLLDMVTSLISTTLAPSTADSIKSESDTSLVNPTSMSSVPSRALRALQDMGMDGLLELRFGEQNMDRSVADTLMLPALAATKFVPFLTVLARKQNGLLAYFVIDASFLLARI